MQFKKVHIRFTFRQINIWFQIEYVAYAPNMFNPQRISGSLVPITKVLTVDARKDLKLKTWKKTLFITIITDLCRKFHKLTITFHQLLLQLKIFQIYLNYPKLLEEVRIFYYKKLGLVLPFFWIQSVLKIQDIYLVQLIEQPILRMPNFNFPKLPI